MDLKHFRHVGENLNPLPGYHYANSSSNPIEECYRHLSTFRDSLGRVTSVPHQVVENLKPYTTNMSMTKRITILSLAVGGFALYFVSKWCKRRRIEIEPKTRSFRAARRARQISISNRNLNSNCNSTESTLKRGSSSIPSTPYFNWNELQQQSFKNSSEKADSVISAGTLVDGTPLTPQQFGLMGMEALETVVDYWEDALSAYNPKNRSNKNVLTAPEETKFIRKLESLLEDAYQLQEASEAIFIDQNSLLNRTVIPKSTNKEETSTTTDGRSSRIRRNSRSAGILSVSSVDNESFVSAQDTIADLRDFEDLEADFPLDLNDQSLYVEALRHLEENEVPCRKMRTEFVGCQTSEEYLAKLHCLRLAFNHHMAKEENRTWWVDTSRQMLSDIMIRSEKDPKDFLNYFDDLIEFLKVPANVEQMEMELAARNVKCTNFYDVALDYILIDSFEDLESPPSSVLAVMQNRWLSNGFKETALSTAIWSVLKAKRRMMMVPNGFKAQFYNISEVLTPVFAWGFFGPDEGLNSLMNFFKNQMLGFVRDLYDFKKVRFSTIENLSDDIMSVAKDKLEGALQRLQKTTETQQLTMNFN